MRTFTRSLLAAATVCVFGASLAHAQSNDHRDGPHKDQRSHQRSAQKPHAQPSQQAHRPNGPAERGHTRSPAYRPAPADLHGQRGAGPNHNWYRGARMPANYRTHHYVVNDWRGHHLSAPPRGYHWVQNGSDYLLVAVVSGVIAQIILGN